MDKMKKASKPKAAGKGAKGMPPAMQEMFAKKGPKMACGGKVKKMATGGMVKRGYGCARKG